MVHNPELQYGAINGYCDKKSKKIGLIRPTKATIIHEICHAVTTKKHGEAWQNRMRKAIETARVLNPEIVRDLEDQLNQCISNNDISPRELERQILEDIQLDAEDYSNPEELNRFLLDCGIFPQYNEKIYRRVHDKAIKIIEHTLRS
jgi:hypothetical protein